MTSLLLDPKSTALVLIDLQNGIMGRTLAPYSAADVVARGAQLASALRAKGGTVPRMGRVRTVEEVLKALA